MKESIILSKDKFSPHKLTIGEYYEKYVKNAEHH